MQKRRHSGATESCPGVSVRCSGVCAMPQVGATSAKGFTASGVKPAQKKANWSAAHKVVANAPNPFAAELYLQMNQCRTDPAAYSTALSRVWVARSPAMFGALCGRFPPVAARNFSA